MRLFLMKGILQRMISATLFALLLTTYINHIKIIGMVEFIVRTAQQRTQVDRAPQSDKPLLSRQAIG